MDGQLAANESFSLVPGKQSRSTAKADVPTGELLERAQTTLSQRILRNILAVLPIIILACLVSWLARINSDLGRPL